MPIRDRNPLASGADQSSFAVRDNTRTRFTRNTGFTPPVNKHSFDEKDVDYTDNPLGYMPVIGDILQAGQSVKDAMNRKYGRAALGAALVAVPNFAERPVMELVDGVSTLLRRPSSSHRLLQKADDFFPYSGRNFLVHGTDEGMLYPLLRGEDRIMITPSYAVTRPMDHNVVGGSPMRYGDYAFLSDKSLLDDAIIYRGDGSTPTLADPKYVQKYGSGNIPSERIDEAAEELWQDTISGPHMGTGPRTTVDNLSFEHTPISDNYFEAKIHGPVSIDKVRYGIYPIPLSSKEEDLLRTLEDTGIPYSLYDRNYVPKYKSKPPYYGYDMYENTLLDAMTGLASGLGFESGGSIHIKPSKRGTFTAAAKKHGKSVQAFASQVLAHKENYSPAMVKKANFARNASKWHEDGGFLQQYPDGGRIKGKRNGKFYVTELNDRREKKFQDWYANAAATLGLDPNPDAYEQAYDYRGYWLNNRDADVSSPDFHFPDTWKQPHHPTFSDESIYAKGHEGVGHWEGETFVPGDFNRLMQATEPASAAPAASTSYGSNYVPSNDILQYIKDTEAFRDKWYQDGNGVWTVGYGFTGDDVRKRYPNGMTRAEADQYFADSVKTRIPMFVGATPNFDRLNQNQRDALFSYYYNIGHGGYTSKSPAMQEALKNFDLDTVVNNIDFGYNDRKNRGLRKRRDYERKLFGTPMDYGGILNRLRNVYGDNESVKAAILRAKNVKK